jgi:DNA polymerase-3 subunit gamma/tau
MSYQVIARKYRPQRFSDVVGQEHVTQTLSRAIEQKRIAHAYLFCGPRGTGKTTIARIFAKSLNCTGGPKVEFDLADPRCVEIAEGRSLDVLEIDGASNNGVEQVRELRETCKYAPASGRYKVYIIDEVHMLSTAAFNALLKTLEEPPEHVKFMFATTDPEKVLPTILSRCQRFDLRRIPTTLIEQHLTGIAAQEKVEINPAALYAIARGAEGGMRDAESTLDQLISFCGDRIEENDVLSMFGLTAQSQLLELARAMLAGEVETSLRQLNELSGHGKDLSRLVTDLLNHFRNLLIYQVSRGDLKMVEVSEAEAGALAQQSQMAGAEGLTRIMEVLAEAEMRLRDAASKKILVEVALLKAIEARNAVSLDSVLKQLQGLRSGGGGGAVAPSPSPAVRQVAAAPAPQPRPAPISASITPAAAPAPAVVATPTVVAKPAPQPAPVAVAAELREPQPEAEPAGASAVAAVEGDLNQLWQKLLNLVGKASPFARSYLMQAHPVSLAKGMFTIGFAPEFEDHIALVDNAKNQALLQAKLQELGHANLHVKFVKAVPPASFAKPGAVASAPAPAPKPAAAPAPATPAVAPGAKAPASANPKAAAPAAPAVPAAPKTVSVPFNKEDFKNDPLIQKALEVFKAQIIEVRV